MTPFLTAMLSVLTGTLLSWAILYALDAPRCKKRLARKRDLEECNRYAMLAGEAIGKDDGEYEKNMRLAVYYLERSYEGPCPPEKAGS